MVAFLLTCPGSCSWNLAELDECPSWGLSWCPGLVLTAALLSASGLGWPVPHLSGLAAWPRHTP